jgi:general secretion pathway protein D
MFNEQTRGKSFPTFPSMIPSKHLLRHRVLWFAVALFWAFSKASTQAAPIQDKTSELAAEQAALMQQSLDKAVKDLADANRSAGEKDWKSAIDSYSAALAALGNHKAPFSELTRERAQAGFDRAAVKLAEQRIQEGRYKGNSDAAEEILTDALTRNPDNKDARKLVEKLHTPGYFNKTITPNFREQIEEVKRLLTEAQGFFDTGRYDLAFKRTDQVLLIDRHNSAARKLQEQINASVRGFARDSYNEARSRAFRKVDESWASPVRKFSATENAQPLNQAKQQSRSDKLREKLSKIIIPEVKFAGETIESVASQLQELSKKHDNSADDTKGVAFVVQMDNAGGAAAAPAAAAAANVFGLNAPAPAAAPAAGGGGGGGAITFHIPTPTPLNVILDTACQMAGVKPVVEEFFVKIVSGNSSGEKMEMRRWKVSPQFLTNTARVNQDAGMGGGGLGALGGGAPAAAGPKNRGGPDAKEILSTRYSVPFPEGSTAIYNSANFTLAVYNERKNLDIIDEVVQAADTPTPSQIEIEAKFIEFSQQNLEELSFDWLLGQSNLPGTYNTFIGGGTTGSARTSSNLSDYPFVIGPGYANTNAPVGVYPVTGGNRSGSLGISANAIDSLLNGVQGAKGVMAPAAFSIAGAFTDPQFQMIVRAMSQKKGVDLLSSPRVTCRNGATASIKITREFRYPTSFAPPQIPGTIGGGVGGGGGGAGVNNQAAQGALSAPVTPANPENFETRNTGVILEVIQPQIQADNFTVDMELKPKVTEFEGFINYGSPIKAIATRTINVGVGGADPVAVTLTDNIMNQPIFSVREVETSVSIMDGHTVALGGLIREDIQKVEDGTPILKSIPVVGRLFQSKIEQHIKKNLVIFVTMRLIDAAGQPVNPTEGLEDKSSYSAPVPNLAQPKVPAGDAN